VIGSAPAPTGAVVDAGPNPASREGVIAFWTSKGAPQHVAEGIADSVKRESSFKSNAWNPDDKGSPSGGLYQHHAERLAGLQGFAAVQNKPWNDAALQHEYAFREVTGKDPIAAAHWKEIVAAPDRATAQTLWDKYFERGVAIGPSGGSGDRTETRRAVGRFGGMAPPKPKTEAEDDLPDPESRRDRDRMRAQLAKIAAQHATAATTQPEEKTVQAAAPAPAAEAKPPAEAKPAAPAPMSNYQPPRFQPPSIPSVQIPQFAAPQPVALPPAPSLGAGYRDVLAALLAPRGGGNPLANILR
jgi:hypothetical protein